MEFCFSLVVYLCLYFEACRYKQLISALQLEDDVVRRSSTTAKRLADSKLRKSPSVYCRIINPH